MATAFTTTVTAIPVLLDGALTNPMEYVSFVLLELLFVLLELPNITAVATAVALELCTTTLSAKLYLEALEVVLTLTQAALQLLLPKEILIPVPLLREQLTIQPGLLASMQLLVRVPLRVTELNVQVFA
jgi:hypothetical protein